MECSIKELGAIQRMLVDRIQLPYVITFSASIYGSSVILTAMMINHHRVFFWCSGMLTDTEIDEFRGLIVKKYEDEIHPCLDLEDIIKYEI